MTGSSIPSAATRRSGVADLAGLRAERADHRLVEAVGAVAGREDHRPEEAVGAVEVVITAAAVIRNTAADRAEVLPMAVSDRRGCRKSFMSCRHPTW